MRTHFSRTAKPIWSINEDPARWCCKEHLALGFSLEWYLDLLIIPDFSDFQSRFCAGSQMLIAVDFWSHKTLIEQLEAIASKSMFFCLTRQSLLCTGAARERWFLLYCTEGQRAEHFIWKITFPDKRTNHRNKCDAQVEIALSGMRGIQRPTFRRHLRPTGSAWIGIESVFPQRKCFVVLGPSF